MQARLSVDGHKDLYEFWGSRLADQFLTCTFGELKGGKVIEKGTMCKMARGQMVRWLAENHVTEPEDIQSFTDLNYHFSAAHSTENNYVFLCGKKSE